jgi:hypothetical protein
MLGVPNIFSRPVSQPRRSWGQKENQPTRSTPPIGGTQGQSGPPMAQKSRGRVAWAISGALFGGFPEALGTPCMSPKRAWARIGAVLGASWGGLGPILGRISDCIFGGFDQGSRDAVRDALLEGHVGTSCRLLGASRGGLGPSWERLGHHKLIIISRPPYDNPFWGLKLQIFGPLGSLLGHLGPVLGSVRHPLTFFKSTRGASEC